MLVIRTGHWKPVTVVTLRLLWNEHGGSLRGEPRLWVRCNEISSDSPLPMGSVRTSNWQSERAIGNL
eukprot:3641098-Pyramimonas_sp.AAC.1